MTTSLLRGRLRIRDSKFEEDASRGSRLKVAYGGSEREEYDVLGTHYLQCFTEQYRQLISRYPSFDIAISKHPLVNFPQDGSPSPIYNCADKRNMVNMTIYL